MRVPIDRARRTEETFRPTNAAAITNLLRANAVLPLEHQHSSRTVNSLRVLWLSPWVRAAVRVQAEALRRRGVDVLLVTSDQHPESDAARDYELVLDPRIRRAATWPATLAAWRRIREYRPDVVIAEMVSDPRWIHGVHPSDIRLEPADHHEVVPVFGASAHPNSTTPSRLPSAHPRPAKASTNPHVKPGIFYLNRGNFGLAHEVSLTRS